jgi:hypothetical protein
LKRDGTSLLEEAGFTLLLPFWDFVAGYRVTFTLLLVLLCAVLGVLRRVFGPKRDGVTGEWRNLHTEELNDLYSLPNIVRVVKSRRMRWVGNVARMGEERVGGVVGTG